MSSKIYSECLTTLRLARLAVKYAEEDTFDTETALLNSVTFPSTFSSPKLRITSDLWDKRVFFWSNSSNASLVEQLFTRLVKERPIIASAFDIREDTVVFDIDYSRYDKRLTGLVDFKLSDLPDEFLGKLKTKLGSY